MSVSLVVDSGDFNTVLKKLAPILDFQPGELMTTLGALGESQTRRRISEEKTAPDGTPWVPNSQGSSILVKSGQHLLYSIAWTASADEAEWGATWDYAHVHQEGMTIVPREADRLAFSIGDKNVFAKEVTIPARPFVGLSSDNIEEILDVVSDHFGVLL